MCNPKFTEEDFEISMDYFYNEIRNDFDYIVSVNKGGNLLGSRFSIWMGLPLFICNPKIPQKVCPKDRVLIAEDIIDTGDTLKIMKALYPNSLVAVLVDRKGTADYCPNIPTFDEGWVDFFWEVFNK